jgi:hypothetical protein
LAGAAGFVQASTVTSTLPALAVQRASGSMPVLPLAPPAEARLAAVGNAAAALALCAVGLAATAFPTVGGALPIVALLIAACGAAGVAFVWIALPQRR